ncbi:MAG: hypothetical protein ACYDEI_00045 [Erysipelotrichaceae bacterium]
MINEFTGIAVLNGKVFKICMGSNSNGLFEFIFNNGHGFSDGWKQLDSNGSRSDKQLKNEIRSKLNSWIENEYNFLAPKFRVKYI